jgi:hypothetical protein
MKSIKSKVCIKLIVVSNKLYESKILRVVRRDGSNSKQLITNVFVMLLTLCG